MIEVLIAVCAGLFLALVYVVTLMVLNSLGHRDQCQNLNDRVSNLQVRLDVLHAENRQLEDWVEVLTRSNAVLLGLEEDDE